MLYRELDGESMNSGNLIVPKDRPKKSQKPKMPAANDSGELQSDNPSLFAVSSSAWGMAKAHLEKALSHLDKAKIYIPDPSLAPEGTQPQQGPNGGWYYESHGASVKPEDQQENDIHDQVSEIVNKLVQASFAWKERTGNVLPMENGFDNLSPEELEIVQQIPPYELGHIYSEYQKNFFGKDTEVYEHSKEYVGELLQKYAKTAIENQEKRAQGIPLKSEMNAVWDAVATANSIEDMADKLPLGVAEQIGKFDDWAEQALKERWKTTTPEHVEALKQAAQMRLAMGETVPEREQTPEEHLLQEWKGSINGDDFLAKIPEEELRSLDQEKLFNLIRNNLALSPGWAGYEDKEAADQSRDMLEKISNYLFQPEINADIAGEYTEFLGLGIELLDTGSVRWNKLPSLSNELLKTLSDPKNISIKTLMEATGSNYSVCKVLQRRYADYAQEVLNSKIYEANKQSIADSPSFQGLQSFIGDFSPYTTPTTHLLDPYLETAGVEDLDALMANPDLLNFMFREKWRDNSTNTEPLMDALKSAYEYRTSPEWRESQERTFATFEEVASQGIDSLKDKLSGLSTDDLNFLNNSYNLMKALEGSKLSEDADFISMRSDIRTAVKGSLFARLKDNIENKILPEELEIFKGKDKEAPANPDWDTAMSKTDPVERMQALNNMPRVQAKAMLWTLDTEEIENILSKGLLDGGDVELTPEKEEEVYSTFKSQIHDPYSLSYVLNTEGAKYLKQNPDLVEQGVRAWCAENNIDSEVDINYTIERCKAYIDQGATQDRYSDIKEYAQEHLEERKSEWHGSTQHVQAILTSYGKFNPEHTSTAQYFKGIIMNAIGDQLDEEFGFTKITPDLLATTLNELNAYSNVFEPGTSYSLSPEKNGISVYRNGRPSANISFFDYLAEYEAKGETVGGFSQQLKGTKELALLNDIDKKMGAYRENNFGHSLGENLISRYVQSWASSSSDSKPLSVAVQKMVAEKFGLEDMTDTYSTPSALEYAAQIKELCGESLGRYIDLAYKHTQDLLEAAGIEEMYLARGMGWTEDNLPDDIRQHIADDSALNSEMAKRNKDVINNFGMSYKDIPDFYEATKHLDYGSEEYKKVEQEIRNKVDAWKKDLKERVPLSQLANFMDDPKASDFMDQYHSGMYSEVYDAYKEKVASEVSKVTPKIDELASKVWDENGMTRDEYLDWDKQNQFWKDFVDELDWEEVTALAAATEGNLLPYNSKTGDSTYRSAGRIAANIRALAQRGSYEELRERLFPVFDSWAETGEGGNFIEDYFKPAFSSPRSLSALAYIARKPDSLKGEMNAIPEAFRKSYIKAITDTAKSMLQENFVSVEKDSTSSRKGPILFDENLPLNPLSSFTTDFHTTGKFDSGTYQITMVAKVPREKVFSSYRTGFGCSNEYEVVVMGGLPNPAKVQLGKQYEHNRCTSFVEMEKAFKEKEESQVEEKEYIDLPEGLNLPHFTMPKKATGSMTLTAALEVASVSLGISGDAFSNFLQNANMEALEWLDDGEVLNMLWKKQGVPTKDWKLLNDIWAPKISEIHQSKKEEAEAADADLYDAIKELATAISGTGKGVSEHADNLSQPKKVLKLKSDGDYSDWTTAQTSS